MNWAVSRTQQRPVVPVTTTQWMMSRMVVTVRASISSTLALHGWCSFLELSLYLRMCNFAVDEVLATHHVAEAVAVVAKCVVVEGLVVVWHLID